MAKCPLASGGVRIGHHWGLSWILPSSTRHSAHLLNKCQSEPFFTLVYVQKWSEMVILCEFEDKILWMASQIYKPKTYFANASKPSWLYTQAKPMSESICRIVFNLRVWCFLECFSGFGFLFLGFFFTSQQAEITFDVSYFLEKWNLSLPWICLIVSGCYNYSLKVAGLKRVPRREWKRNKFWKAHIVLNGTI